jgi:hypothetical protein
MILIRWDPECYDVAGFDLYFCESPVWVAKVIEMIVGDDPEVEFRYQMYGKPDKIWEGTYLPGWKDRSDKSLLLPREAYDSSSRNRQPITDTTNSEALYYWWTPKRSNRKKNKNAITIPAYIRTAVQQNPRYIQTVADCSELKQDRIGSSYSP